jgi:1,4-alpha-glucan branching enzyme
MVISTEAKLGSRLSGNGAAFTVWAPNAKKVSVIGSFNDWKAGAHPMKPGENGEWDVHIPKVKAGDEYLYAITTASGDELTKNDPYAREVTNSVGNSVVVDETFDWGDDSFVMPPLNEIVLYELHIGTFHNDDHEGPGTFDSAIKRLSHLKQLGFNCLEIMPVAEFAGDFSWGYNPAHIFAVETAYGGPAAFKRFVKACHDHGLGVILDVVYNHFGPSDLDLWQFDGWSENEKGGIYFYNDHRSKTPWGDTRPDYGRPEVRRFLRDNVMMWLEDYRVDGLRYDATVYIRTIDGLGGDVLEDGWKLFQGLNSEVRQRFPGKILIAEDLQDDAALTAPPEQGGAGFHAQWCSRFVHPVREVIKVSDDDHRSMTAVASAIAHDFNGDPFQRVIYSESHDEVANGKQRVVSEVKPDDPTDWHARKRSTLAAGIVFTTPGVPMIFQGQEFLKAGHFEDTVPLDWDLKDEFPTVVRFYRDLVAWRTNRFGNSKGLTAWGCRITRVDEEKNVLAYHRYEHGGAGDDVMVVANFSHHAQVNFRIGLPCGGTWHERLNSDWSRYGSDLTSPVAAPMQADDQAWDNLPASLELSLPAYSLVILSQ